MAIDTNTAGDAGWLTNGVPLLPLNSGVECLAVDTQLPGGQQPQSAAMNLQALALAVNFLNNSATLTPTNGYRNVTQVNIGVASTITGVSVLVGGTGGTDKWIVELHDSNGVLVATSTLSGTTAGTAASWQQIAFTAPYKAAPGVYYVVVQSNGNTALLIAYNAPTFPLATVTVASGTFGTSASITPPTTYVAGEGPIVQLY